MDRLDKLFEMQASLNDNIFKKKDIRDSCGYDLKTKGFAGDNSSGVRIGPNSMVNKWLINFLDALDDESRELREELLWKWWSKDTLNIQNIRVEIIDILHFWISLAMTSGMTADKVFDIYVQKNEVNLKRQEDGYSKENKNESDNKNIK